LGGKLFGEGGFAAAGDAEDEYCVGTRFFVHIVSITYYCLIVELFEMRIWDG
jgi:hypothetical protein